MGKAMDDVSISHASSKASLALSNHSHASSSSSVRRKHTQDATKIVGAFKSARDTENAARDRNLVGFVSKLKARARSLVSKQQWRR